MIESYAERYRRESEEQTNDLVKGDAQDPYGNRIMIGSTVAYNYSGEVRMGVVQKLSRRLKYGYSKGYIEVKLIPGRIDKGYSRISKVTRPENLIVLNSPEEAGIRTPVSGDSGSNLAIR